MKYQVKALANPNVNVAMALLEAKSDLIVSIPSIMSIRITTRNESGRVAYSISKDGNNEVLLSDLGVRVM